MRDCRPKGNAGKGRFKLSSGGAARRLIYAAIALRVSAPEFDHYGPAAWLIENPNELKGQSASVTMAIERFEEMFKRLNALLPKG
jgi:hypothetical protein